MRGASLLELAGLGAEGFSPEYVLELDGGEGPDLGTPRKAAGRSRMRMPNGAVSRSMSSDSSLTGDGGRTELATSPPAAGSS